MTIKTPHVRDSGFRRNFIDPGIVVWLDRGIKFSSFLASIVN
jgi:hypothetical protein